jgi:hypothetical protein
MPRLRSLGKGEGKGGYSGLCRRRCGDGCPEGDGAAAQGEVVPAVTLESLSKLYPARQSATEPQTREGGRS